MKKIIFIYLISLSSVAFAQVENEELEVFLGNYELFYPENQEVCSPTLEILRNNNGRVEIASPSYDFWPQEVADTSDKRKLILSKLAQPPESTPSAREKAELILPTRARGEGQKTKRTTLLEKTDENNYVLEYFFVDDNFQLFSVNYFTFKLNTNTGVMEVRIKTSIARPDSEQLSPISDFTCHYLLP